MNKEKVTKLDKINNSSTQSTEIITVAKGAGIIFIGMVLGTGLKYLFELIIARNLGPELFGLFFLGLAVFKVTELISTFGLHRSVVRYIALSREEMAEERTKGTIIFAIRIVLVVGLVVSLLIIFFSKAIAVNIFHDIDLTNVLRFFAIAIPFSAITNIEIFSTLGFKIMKYKVYVRELFEPLSRILVVIVLLALGWKLFGAISAFIIAIILGTFLAFFYIKRLFPEITNKKLRAVFESRKILDFSWPVLFAEILSLAVIWINILMIGAFETSQEVGIYSAAHRTALISQIIIISFNSISGPIIADLYNKKAFDTLEKLYKIIIKWILSLNLPLCLLMTFFSSEILNIFGRNFIKGAQCLIVLSIAQLVNSFVSYTGFLIMMTGKSKLNLLNNIIIVTLNIGLNFFLIPKYGIMGAAFSLFLSIVCVSLIILMEISLILKLKPFKRDIYKPFLAGGASLLSLYLIVKYLFQSALFSLVTLLTFSLMFLGTYALIFFILGIGEEDKIILQKLKWIKSIRSI